MSRPGDDAKNRHNEGRVGPETDTTHEKPVRGVFLNGGHEAESKDLAQPLQIARFSLLYPGKSQNDCIETGRGRPYAKGL